MTKLTILGTDPAQQKAFLAEMKAKVKARVPEASDNTGGAAAAAARAVQDRDVSILDVHVLQAQMLIQSGTMKPNKALETMIKKHLGESHDESLAVYLARQVLKGLEVFTPEYKQELLDTVTKNHPFLILDLKPAEQAALIAAYAAESGKEVDIQQIPHDFIIRHEFKQYKASKTSTGAFIEILTDKYGPNILTAQYAALQDMAEHANFEYKHDFQLHRDDKHDDFYVDAARGEAYFKKQYGDTRELQLARMLEEFGKTPQEVNQDTNIPKNFVTLGFIEKWTALTDGPEVKAHQVFEDDYLGLENAPFRLPYALTQHKDTITTITINAQCTHIPGWFGELSSVKALTITQEKPLTYVHDFSDFKGKLVIPELKRSDLTHTGTARRGALHSMTTNMEDAIAALASMKAQANDGLTSEELEEAFCLNYGETPFQQLLTYVQENDKLPEAADLMGVMNADYLALSRDPTFKPAKLKRIPLALRQHAKTFIATKGYSAPTPTGGEEHTGRPRRILDLSNNQLTTLPKWLEEFGEITVNVQKNRIATRAGFPFNSDSRLGLHDERITCPLKFYLADNPYAKGHYYEQHGNMFYRDVLDVPFTDQQPREGSAGSQPFKGY